jgi:hypothetical protein
MARAVGADEAEVEAFWLVEIELHGGQGFLAPGRVHHLDVDLRPVERRLARGVLVVEAEVVQGGGQMALGAGPGIIASDFTLVWFAQIG